MPDMLKEVGYILCEETMTNVEFKIKDENKNGFVTAEGIVQEGDEVNRNRRYYPTEELASNIKSPRTVELVTTGNLKGEAGHPMDKSLQRQTKIDPTLEQVWYKKLWMDGNYVKAWFRGTNNELGRSFNDDLKDGQKPSFSLRAVGSLVNENGRMTVRKMQMITYDRVYFPSHSKAYTTALVTSESTMHEAQQYLKINKDSYYHYKENEINDITVRGNDVTMNESVTIPITQKQVSNYLVNESANIKSAMDVFDVLYESMELSPDGSEVTMKLTNGDTIHLCLEDAIRKEILEGVSMYF